MTIRVNGVDISGGGGGAPLPTDDPTALLEGVAADAFVTTNGAGNGSISTAAEAAALLSGQVVDPLTSVGTWTASNGDSGRGSVVFGGGGLAIGITIGASVGYDITFGGFHGPNISKTLPVGGARGVRVVMTYTGLTNDDNRLALALRASTRDNAMVAIQIVGNTETVELLNLAPSTTGRGASGATGARAAGALCLDLVAGQVTGYYATTTTPTAADWLCCGTVDVETASLTSANSVSACNIALATYAAVASSATVTSWTCEAL